MDNKTLKLVNKEQHKAHIRRRISISIRHISFADHREFQIPLSSSLPYIVCVRFLHEILNESSQLPQTASKLSETIGPHPPTRTGSSRIIQDLDPLNIEICSGPNLHGFCPYATVPPLKVVSNLHTTKTR
jgi:hypothetical protein